MYKEISFESFEGNYINDPDGFLPVWFSLDENNYLNLDMACLWRLTDGKVRFLKILIVNKGQLNKAFDYLKVTQKLINKSLEQNFKDVRESGLNKG